MSEINWDLLAQYPNAGQAFEQSFQKGQQENALAAFATNPNSQTAGAAARYDPGTVLQYNLQSQKEQQAISQERLNEWHKYAGELAKWADTPEKRNQAIDHLLSTNHPDISTQDLLTLKNAPPETWPAMRASFMAQGGVQDDQDPGDIREYNDAVANKLLPGGTTFQQFLQLKNPGMNSPVNIPYGATVTAGGSAMPTVATPEDAGRLPPGTHFRTPDGRVKVVPGGAGGNASGGFPQ